MCKIYSYEEAKTTFPEIFSEIPIKLAELCKKMDIDVLGVKDDDTFCGSIKYNIERKKFQIYVNSSHSYGRIRFTVAHELAHYFLHNDIVRVRAIEDKTVNRIQGIYNQLETEANQLASKILMPEENIFMDVKQQTGNKIDVSSLAAKYAVSESSMGYRLTNLGIL